jgi:hypothetical protein
MHPFIAETLAHEHRDRLLADAQRRHLARNARQHRSERVDIVRTVRRPRPWHWLRRRRVVIATA